GQIGDNGAVVDHTPGIDQQLTGTVNGVLRTVRADSVVRDNAVIAVVTHRDAAVASKASHSRAIEIRQVSYRLHRPCVVVGKRVVDEYDIVVWLLDRRVAGDIVERGAVHDVDLPGIAGHQLSSGHGAGIDLHHGGIERFDQTVRVGERAVKEDER